MKRMVLIMRIGREINVMIRKMIIVAKRRIVLKKNSKKVLTLVFHDVIIVLADAERQHVRTQRTLIIKQQDNPENS